ncbi:DinB family protein [Nocardiopsis ansamitocini]|nr:DinB family protein [Nocardiopsis ansamitocini]
MTTLERSIPPLNGDERATLEGWLDFHRQTLAVKCAGLDNERSRRAAAPPSPITLLGLVRHMAEVERNWFRRILAGERLGPVYGDGLHPQGTDGGFTLPDHATLAEALATWHTEVDHARARAAGYTLDATCNLQGARCSLRWIYLHMIEEYARHNGHADLIREAVDGNTGI